MMEYITCDVCVFRVGGECRKNPPTPLLVRPPWIKEPMFHDEIAHWFKGPVWPRVGYGDKAHGCFSGQVLRPEHNKENGGDDGSRKNCDVPGDA